MTVPEIDPSGVVESGSLLVPSGNVSMEMRAEDELLSPRTRSTDDTLSTSPLGPLMSVPRPAYQFDGSDIGGSFTFAFSTSVAFVDSFGRL